MFLVGMLRVIVGRVIALLRGESERERERERVRERVSDYKK